MKSVRVNGKNWSSTALPHDLIANGGKIEFEMTDQPTKWGTGRNDAPPSITKPGEDPTTWRDSTSDTGAVIGAGGADVSALIDNDSKTQVTLTGAQPTVTVALPQGRPVGMYTLTSGATGTAPSAWTLEGSNDGTTWTTVDKPYRGELGVGVVHEVVQHQRAQGVHAVPAGARPRRRAPTA